MARGTPSRAARPAGPAAHRVDLLEWVGGDTAGGNVDVSFVLGPGPATVFNALDENGPAFGPPDARQRCHVLRRGPSHGGRAG
ncbi:hypothetical protein GCM10010273_65880 [Streptomyces lavendulocolor]